MEVLSCTLYVISIFCLSAFKFLITLHPVSSSFKDFLRSCKFISTVMPMLKAFVDKRFSAKIKKQVSVFVHLLCDGVQPQTLIFLLKEKEVGQQFIHLSFVVPYRFAPFN